MATEFTDGYLTPRERKEIGSAPSREEAARIALPIYQRWKEGALVEEYELVTTAVGQEIDAVINGAFPSAQGPNPDQDDLLEGAPTSKSAGEKPPKPSLTWEEKQAREREAARREEVVEKNRRERERQARQEESKKKKATSYREKRSMDAPDPIAPLIETVLPLLTSAYKTEIITDNLDEDDDLSGFWNYELQVLEEGLQDQLLALNDDKRDQFNKKLIGAVRFETNIGAIESLANAIAYAISYDVQSEEVTFLEVETLCSQKYQQFVSRITRLIGSEIEEAYFTEKMRTNLYSAIYGE